MKRTNTEITTALKAARKAAEALPQIGNGGTCNFDAAVIFLPRMRRTTAAKIAEAAGVSLMNFGPWIGRSGCYWVGGWDYGQGTDQTNRAEAASKALADAGIETTVYYAMD